MSETSLPILPLGIASLRRPSEAVVVPSDPGVSADSKKLVAALHRFFMEFGFGRAIAAPQIGVQRRVVALRIPEWPELIYNPEITWTSDETFTMWDDCMCFPELLVLVRRHRSISVRYMLASGDEATREHLDIATSELLQHEIDHLNGILAIDRTLSTQGIISRAAFNEEPERFVDQVDYIIMPVA